MTNRIRHDRGVARGLTNYGDADFSLYLRRSFASSMGYSREMLDRPVVGICHAAGGFNNCHRQVPEMIEAVKRGVLSAGALPLEFPTISLGEVFLNPTSLMFRNLMSMDVEEMIRAQPMDAVVLMGGCDKTVPAQLMGAASAGVPAIQLVAGPMMTGRWRADRLRAAEATGAAAVRLAAAKLTPDRIITPRSVENALRVLLALGGSTNAVIHLTAVAGRLGIEIPLKRINELSDATPVLVDLKPTGQHYMEDFYAAGGMSAVLRELRPSLHLDCLSVTGETLGERLDAERELFVDHGVIRPAAKPIEPAGGLVALFGSLAPRGAILKRSAADKSLFEREGRAVVFTSLEDLAARMDSPDLDVRPDDFLVLQNAGPTSGTGLPEAGYLPIPAKLARAGVKDMVRISDARMSGTAYGAVVLHVTPEAAAGGPLALVRNGDRIRLSVSERKLDLLVDESELRRRKEEWTRQAASRPPPPPGYAKPYFDTVLPADPGCPFDFLNAGGAAPGSRAGHGTAD